MKKAGKDPRATPALTWQVEKGGFLADRERIIRNIQETFTVRYYRVKESRDPKVRKTSSVYQLNPPVK